MKKMSSRKMTSVIDAIENAAIMLLVRFRDMALTLCGLVEQVHKLHGLGLEQVHHLVDAGHEIVVGKQRDDADDKAGHGGAMLAPVPAAARL